MEMNADRTRITMRKPFDMHHHVRDGETMKLVVPMLAKRFAGAIIMPNTDPPMVTSEQVVKYRADILDAAQDEDFNPLMTFYLSDKIDPRDLKSAIRRKHIHGVKFYPYGLTTNSEFGISNTSDLWTPGTRAYEILRVLADQASTLLLHAADGFDTEGIELDPYDQEKHFFAETLPRIIEAHPVLGISVEHISTKEGAEYMAANGGPLLGCSVTAQHLLLDRRDVHRKGFNPDRFWWPIIQRAEHKKALLTLVSKGHRFVWLGSDSAPHPLTKKYASCCGGGVLTAHAGIELYVEPFHDADALDKLEDFASVNGPRFYGIKPSAESITLVQEDWTVLQDYSIPVAQDADPLSSVIRPFRLGETLKWKLVS
ncbi:MAG: dihydroorotase [Parcubacteria group bacterium]|nr:dihydroorotase [Parcubacteria group bacterium]